MATKTHLWELGGLLRREHLPSDANAVTTSSSAVPGAHLVVAGLAYWVGFEGTFEASGAPGLFGSIVVCVLRSHPTSVASNVLPDVLLSAGMALVIGFARRPRAAGPLARSMLLRSLVSSALGALLGLMSAQLSGAAAWTS